MGRQTSVGAAAILAILIEREDTDFANERRTTEPSDVRGNYGRKRRAGAVELVVVRVALVFDFIIS